MYRKVVNITCGFIKSRSLVKNVTDKRGKMTDKNISKKIIESLEKVEHPSISATLLDLGMLRDVKVTPEGKVSFTIVLPFPNIPENVRNYLINSLTNAAQTAGGELEKADLAIMSEEERQNFLLIEQQNWRGSM